MPSTSMPPPPSPLAHRRSRVIDTTTTSFPISPPLSPQSPCTLRKMSLSKGATFHVSSSPPSEDDPKLSIRYLTHRSPTSPRASLVGLISDKEDVAARSILDFEQTFSGARGKRMTSHRLSDAGQQFDLYRLTSLPSDEGLGSSISPSSEKGLARSFDRILDLVSDSGLGSSIDDRSTKEQDNNVRVTSEDDGLVEGLIQGADNSEFASPRTRQQGNRHLKAHTSSTRSAVTHSISPQSSSPTRRHPHLSNFARNTISQNILRPILEEERFKTFHPLVQTLGSKSNKAVRCLRDLEQSLISHPLVSRLQHLAGTNAHAYHLALIKNFAVSPQLYRLFGEFSIQLVLDTYQHLSESDQRRAADRPYDNGYFLDLVQQVGRLASQVGTTRRRNPAQPNEDDISDDEMAYSAEDEVTLEGGLSQTGEYAELVRWKNGKAISLRTNEPYHPLPGIKRQHSSDTLDDEAERSMARRKKNAEHKPTELACSDETCDKTFTRKCDLAKHEKTHSRPYKCPEPTCKYHAQGLPTEKERDRHINDKHDPNPHFYKCDYCEFKTKRESNCKQHMEKKHNWVYERVKGNSKPGTKTTPAATPNTPSMDYFSPSEQSPAPSAPWDDGSAASASMPGSTSATPYDRPIQSFEGFTQPSPAQQDYSLFPRTQRRYIATENGLGFEAMAHNLMYAPANHFNGYVSPVHTTPITPQMVMGTPVTPAHSIISNYGPSPHSLNIMMDYQGTGAWETGLPTPGSNFLQPHSRNPSISYGSPLAPFAVESNFADHPMTGGSGDEFLSQSQLPVNDFGLFNMEASAGYHQSMNQGSDMQDAALFQQEDNFGDANYNYGDETMDTLDDFFRFDNTNST